MTNKFLKIAKNELRKQRLDAYIFKLSNENLYEFVSNRENIIVELTGFTGDTAEVLLYGNKVYLLVDGRFTIQAKKEINDDNIKVISLDNFTSVYDFYSKIFKKGNRVGINAKLISIANFFKLKNMEKVEGIKLVDMPSFLSKEISDAKKNSFYMSCAPLFMLDKRYVSENTKEKIIEALKYIKWFTDKSEAENVARAIKFGYSAFPYGKSFDISRINYVTSSEEEIAFITNLRYKFADIDNHGPLFKSFMILNMKKSTLYINDYIEDKFINELKRFNIYVKKCEDFYDDLRRIKDKEYCFIDPSINNYHIFKSLRIPKKNLIVSPFNRLMSIKGDTEIRNLRKCNVIDGVAITKAIYNLKANNAYKNEYEIAKMVDKMRKDIGKNNFLCNSFETIVAYKENSAICHYIPKKNRSKKIARDGILLIDSGGNYLFGTTDITRTISLYKNKNKIPKDIKKYYTIILNAMFNLASQKFPYGLTGSELDIIARSELYNEYLDFMHGTGHGIGYISNVHEGPNRIGPGIKKMFYMNVLEPGQLQSDEPGIYFENKYGIRIENDILCIKEKDTKYVDFLGFEMMTLCPFDKDLIDKKYLSKNTLKELKEYNLLVYKKLSPYMNKKEKAWLREETCL